MTREIDFSDPNYRELTRELALGVLNGPYTEAMEDGTRVLNLGEVAFEVLNSEWLANVKREARAEALEEAADKFAAEDDPEWGIWQDYEGWSLHPSEPLRNLAAEYRKENTDD